MKFKNDSTEKKEKQINIFLFIIIVIILSLGGGLGGAIFAKPYITNDLYNLIPQNKDVNISQDSLRQANAVIENAKKIIVSQEKKIDETVSSGQNSLVGVFKKKEQDKPTGKKGAEFNLADYYKLDEEIGEGLVVTSDGWILISDFSKNAAENIITKNYVAITKSKDVYPIDKAIKTGIDSYIFIHLSGAKDLPVKGFVGKLDLSASQSLLALNWRGETYLTSIVDRQDKNGGVKDSDGVVESLILSDNLGDYFDNAFIFTLNSEVAGFFDKKNGPMPLDIFQPLIKGLLEKKENKRPTLGVSYVNLENFAIKNPGYENGALLYPNGKSPAVKEGSAAKLAGLKEGDIITSVNNTAVDASHDLADLIQIYSAGDEINIFYRRAGQENAMKIKLGELK
jgi:hypothetical protein